MTLVGLNGTHGRIGRLAIALGLVGTLAACGPQSNPQTFLDAMGPSADAAADQALAALARGDYAAAETSLDAALKRDPRNPYALLAGGLLYQSTNRPLKARQMYEDLLAQRPNGAATVQGWDPSRVVPLADIAAANIRRVDADLQRGGSAWPAASTSAPMPGLVAPVAAVAPEIAPLDPRTRAIADRFLTLRKLRDEQLITPEEYAARRTANAGALLPLSKSPPAAGLDRPVPGIEQIVERLKALQQGLQSRAITPREYELERDTILNALLPSKPTTLAPPEPAPKDLLASAERMRQLERLHAMNLITEAEMKAELAALEAGLRSSGGAPGPVATVPVSGGPQMLVPGSAAERASAAAPLPGQTTVHLASYRSNVQAQEGWVELLKRFPAQLSTLAPDVRKVPVAGKGDYYRLYAGPVASHADAAAICRALAAKRQFCKVTND